MAPATTTSSTDESPLPVPTTDEAAAALRELDAAQATIGRLTPGRMQLFVSNAAAYAAGILVAIGLTSSYRHNHHVDRIALGVVLVIAATIYIRAYDQHTRRLGISATRLRVPRTGERQIGIADGTALYLCAVVGVANHSWFAAGAVFVVVAIADFAIAALRKTGLLRRLTPSRFRATPITFYREFLSHDLWRVAGALAIVYKARPGVLANELGLTRDQVDDALVVLDDLGYLSAAGKKGDGRGQLVGLNHFGRQAFRHQLAALEDTVSPPRRRRVASA